MTTRLAIALSFGLSAVSACGDAGDPAGSTCVITGAVGTGGEPIGGALAIGVGAAGSFQPVAAGSSLELVMGSQGAWMVLPVLRVDGDGVTAGGPCPHVRFDVAVGSGVEVDQTLTPPFERSDDGFWYSNEIELGLSLDIEQVEGQEASIEASIDDGDVSASVAVDRLLLLNER